MDRTLKTLGIFGVLVLFIAAVYTYEQAKAPGHTTGSSFFGALDSQVEIKENLPEPLRKLQNLTPGLKTEPLTSAEIIRLTNAERTKLGLTKLKENQRLKVAAEAKIADMFKNQYFEHISPSGLGPSDIIKGAGYAYIMVGENLAEGDFESNAELLLGWMNSPGHRANIVHPRYTEIGAAAKKGRYQGRLVWMAVQEFGKPLADCPSVNSSLKAEIQLLEVRAKLIQEQLSNLNEQMTNAKASNNIELYNSLVPQYNALIEEANGLVQQTKELVNTYNTEVQNFNACLE